MRLSRTLYPFRDFTTRRMRAPPEARCSAYARCWPFVEDRELLSH